jgi:hypothetical protein
MKKRHIRTVTGRLFELCKQRNILPSSEPIDVVIPLIKKDLSILPLCLQGVRNCVSHPIRGIYIVAPEIDEIKEFCKREKLIYTSEKTVLGIGPEDINLLVTTPNGQQRNRSGWLFQQILKLCGKVGTCQNYLCIDSDHILLQPHPFVNEQNSPVFYMSSEKHVPYYKTITALTGQRWFSCLSYVAHKMLFNKETLEMLHAKIEKHTGKNWIQAVVDSYDRNENSGFSEFELYGNFVKKKLFRPWTQIALGYDKLDSYDALCVRYGKRYKAITFPSYLS